MGLAVIRNEVKLKWRESRGDMFNGFTKEHIELIMEIIIIAASPLPFLDDISFYFSNDFVDGEVMYNFNFFLGLLLCK